MQDILIVDAGLEDLDVLVAQRRPDVRVVAVSASEDVHTVLAGALAAHPSAIHLLGHGAPGMVKIGARPLDASSLLDRSWPDASGVDIHIHACRVAEGPEGRAFLDRLAAATGATVAAATGLVGDAELGGDWTLDAVTAPMRTVSAFAAPVWAHTLPAVPGTDESDMLNGTDTAEETFQGGLGDDTVDYAEGGVTDPILIDLDNLDLNQGAAAGDVYEDIEVIAGGGGDDTLYGDEGDNWFRGHLGDDVEYGRGGNDTLEAADGNDTLYGGDGDDRVVGLANDDDLYGEAGADTLIGYGGADLMYGDDGNDVIYADWDNDTIYGGIGDDTIYAGEVVGTQEADTIQGGDGNDRYVITNQAGAGTVSFNGGAGTDTLEITSAQVAHPDNPGASYTVEADINIAGMTLDGVETLALTGAAGIGVHMTAAQALAFDNITGSSNDIIYIDGEFNPDDINVTGGVQVVAEGSPEEPGGADTLPGGAETLPGAINGTAAADSLAGGNASETFAGLAGNDTIDGAAGSDTIIGGAGDDYMTGGDGRDTFVIAAGDGLDQIADFDVGPGGDVLDLRGLEDAEGNAITTLAQLQVLQGPVPEFLIIPGESYQEIRLIGVSASDLTEDNVTFGADTPTGPLPIEGTAAAETITGTAAADTILAGGGDDTITGGAGNDTMSGDIGRDTFVITASAGNDHITDFTVGAGGDVLDLRSYTGITTLAQLHDAAGETEGTIELGGGQELTLAGVSIGALTAENVILATPTPTGPDPIIGDDSANLLEGTAQGETIEGGGGADTITGNGGDDVLDGGAGRDIFVIASGDGNDRIVNFEVGADGDVLDLRSFTSITTLAQLQALGNDQGVLTLGTGQELTLDGVSVDDLTSANVLLATAPQVPGDGGNTGGDTGGNTGGSGGGSGGPGPVVEPPAGAPAGTEGADAITGDDSAETMSGGLGADSLRGGLGGDLIYGNQDNDLVYGNQGDDSLFGGQGADSIFGGQGTDVVYGNLADDAIYGNLANDSLYGGQGNDGLFGGQGDDVLFGNLGDDRLNGNLGNDTLTGGTGADIFVFRAGGNDDVITDFSFADGDRMEIAEGMNWTVSSGDGGAVINFADGDSITLQGVATTDVTSDWFING